MPLRYRPYFPRRAVQQGGSDVERGLSIGSQIGKGLGGLAQAIKGAQDSARQDALANRLMNTQDAPRAALVSPGSAGTVDPNADLSTDLPEDVSSAISTPNTPLDPGTYSNPATGNIEPLQGGDQGDQGVIRGTATDYTPNVIPPGVSTAGTSPITGGVAEMKMRQEFGKSALEDQINKARLADLQAKAAGTGSYAVQPPSELDTARLAEIKARTAAIGQKKPGAVADEEPVSIGTEPVTNQAQLVKSFDGLYGKNSFADVIGSIHTPPPPPPDPNQPIDSKAPTAESVGAPVEVKDANGNVTAVTVGPRNKRITIPIETAQKYVKQQNALNIRQGLPAYRVPGEDQSVGATQNNPYIAKNNLDVYSRAPGTWIRLPNGKVAQVPQRGGK